MLFRQKHHITEEITVFVFSQFPSTTFPWQAEQFDRLFTSELLHSAGAMLRCSRLNQGVSLMRRLAALYRSPLPALRSYDNYLTDFIPPRNQPIWADYETPRVYRLYHDPVPILRMKAFLSCIREYEGQEERVDAKRYQLLDCALPETTSKHFTSFETHPWANVPKENRGVATAAGAYKISYETWDELLTGKNNKGHIVLRKKMFSLKPNEKKFTPAMQNRMAVAIIENEKALGYVRKGEIDEAVNKLKHIWSSFPGGDKNAKKISVDKRPMDMGYFGELFAAYLAAEKKEAGIK